MSNELDSVVSLDRYTVTMALPESLLQKRLADGTLPFVRIVKVDAPSAPLEVLPADAALVRCVTTDQNVHLVAEVRGALVHLFTNTSTSVTVAAATDTQAEHLAEEMRARLGGGEAAGQPVRLWHHDCDRGPTFVDRTIDAPAWPDIRANYPEQTRAALDSLVTIKDPVASGRLILWHGQPGTGKTTALRSLASAWEPWCDVNYLSDPEKFFAETEYLARVLASPVRRSQGPTLTRAGRPEERWRLIVAEDSDEYLRASARRDAGASLGRLLNLADGILGQGRKVVILLTTNEELSRLHPALIRSGRCLARIRFDLFPTSEASTWLGRRVDEPTSLADLLGRRGDIPEVIGTEAEAGSTGQYL